MPSIVAPMSSFVPSRRTADVPGDAPLTLAEETLAVNAVAARDELVLGAKAAGRAFAVTTVWTAAHLPEPTHYLTTPTVRASLALVGTGLCLLEGFSQAQALPPSEDSIVGEDEVANTYDRMRRGAIAGSFVLTGTFIGAHVGIIAGDYISKHLFGFA